MGKRITPSIIYYPNKKDKNKDIIVGEGAKNKKNDYTQTPLTKEEFEKKIMEEKNNNSLNNNKDDNSDTFYIKEEASKSSIFYN